MSPSKTSANLSGYATILLWSFSAFFIGLTAQTPPLLLASLSSVVGFIFYVCVWVRSPKKLKIALNQPWQVWALFFLAVVVYRGTFLAGMKLAPIVEANLLNYLWPLLIVVFSIFIDRKKLSKRMLAGTVLCFAGVVLIGLNNKKGVFSFEWGHILAILSAFIWALYSILTRRYETPSYTIGVMHFVAAILFFILHLLFEPHVDLAHIPAANWAGVVWLGLSISLGYSLWDKAMTYGNREKVAIAAYYTPLLSTLWLVVLGHNSMSLYVMIAAVLIIGGSYAARTQKKKPS